MRSPLLFACPVALSMERVHAGAPSPADVPLSRREAEVLTALGIQVTGGDVTVMERNTRPVSIYGVLVEDRAALSRGGAASAFVARAVPPKWSQGWCAPAGVCGASGFLAMPPRLMSLFAGFLTARGARRGRMFSR